MGEIVKYIPTAGMSAAQRNDEGYYAIMKAWVQSLSEIFGKHFTVSYNDSVYYIYLNVTTENISDRRIRLGISSHKCAISFLRDSLQWDGSMELSLDNDDPFYIYDGDDFFIGGGTKKCIAGIFKGKAFDTNTDVPVFMGSGSGYFRCWINNGNMISLSTVYRRDAAATNVYVVQRFIPASTNVALQNVCYIDSGMSLPPENDFKIGNDKYCMIKYNIVVKI